MRTPLDTAFRLPGNPIAALSLAALSLAALSLTACSLAPMSGSRVSLRRPVKLENWGTPSHGFFSDTCRSQAPVIFRVRDVPGVHREHDGWVLLALQIHNNKNYNVDRRDSLEPRSICFLFFGMVIGHYLFYYCSYCSHVWLSAFLLCARLTSTSSRKRISPGAWKDFTGRSPQS